MYFKEYLHCKCLDSVNYGETAFRKLAAVQGREHPELHLAACRAAGKCHRCPGGSAKGISWFTLLLAQFALRERSLEVLCPGIIDLMASPE